jgi:hypothetical protein
MTFAIMTFQCQRTKHAASRQPMIVAQPVAVKQKNAAP